MTTPSGEIRYGVARYFLVIKHNKRDHLLACVSWWDLCVKNKKSPFATLKHPSGSERPEFVPISRLERIYAFVQYNTGSDEFVAISLRYL